jgi:hypothetical protein
MAIFAALIALGSRFAGKVLTTALGWAATLLFGRVPADRQILLVGITFGSVIWLALLVGVIVPDVGTFLLLLLPAQDIIPESIIRLLMLAGALIVPGVVGGLTLALRRGGERTPRAVATAVARGYPLTVLLAVLLLFLAGLAIWRKVTSVVRGWTDAHVPIVITGGAYDKVAADLDAAVTAAGLEVEPRDAPRSMSAPARWLAAIAGGGPGGLVPERMIQLDGKDLDILIYPMDLLISGKPALVARARAAMASRLTTSAAHLTVSAEAQAIEDRLARLSRRPDGGEPPRFDDAAATTFAGIDEELARIEIPYEEWEVLYRQRLQVERDLRARAMAAAVTDEPAVVGAISKVGKLLRSGAEAALEVAADDKTGQALDRLAGPEWRWAARTASVAATAAREIVRPPAEEDAPDVTAGEPLPGPSTRDDRSQATTQRR